MFRFATHCGELVLYFGMSKWKVEFSYGFGELHEVLQTMLGQTRGCSMRKHVLGCMFILWIKIWEGHEKWEWFGIPNTNNEPQITILHYTYLYMEVHMYDKGRISNLRLRVWESFDCWMCFWSLIWVSCMRGVLVPTDVRIHGLMIFWWIVMDCCLDRLHFLMSRGNSLSSSNEDYISQN